MNEPEAIKVRKAEASDAAAIIELRNRILSETAFMLWEPGEFQDSVEDEAKRIERLNNRDNCLLIVAEAGGQLIGNLTAYGGETRRIRHRATIALGVAKEHWSKGAATAMLDFVLRWSRERKLRRVELTVHTTNVRALACTNAVGSRSKACAAVRSWWTANTSMSTGWRSLMTSKAGQFLPKMADPRIAPKQ